MGSMTVIKIYQIPIVYELVCTKIKFNLYFIVDQSTDDKVRPYYRL